MAEVKWIKIVTDIFEDEKILLIEALPDADSIIVIWFKLLCLAGKQNNSGVFRLNDRIAYTDEMLATIFRRPINKVRLALETFEQFNMIEIINNVITVPNWDKHQSLDQLEARRKFMREYMTEKRDKQKLLTTCKPNSKPNSKPNVNCADIDIERDIDIDKDIYMVKTDKLFLEFWSEYPKKIGKGAAEKIWNKIKPNKELTTKMVQAIKTFKTSEQWTKENGQFIPNPATWLNQKRWEDEITNNKTIKKDYSESWY